jgi:TetR/AcrR family transcriptional regulator, regulator of cefoperazone and chloramphenicol sensitivity
MARDATLTRSRLLRAGEFLFAREGVAGTRMSDVVRRAGQANESAVSYHFGSRDGLLAAIVAKHMESMESRRKVPEGDDLNALVREAVVPTARLLKTEDGRDFLRIIDQLAGYSGVGARAFAEPLQGTVLEQQLTALQDLLRPRLGRRLADERVATMVLFLTSSLAERARTIDGQTSPPCVPHDRYVEELVLMLSGALAA